MIGEALIGAVGVQKKLKDEIQLLIAISGKNTIHGLIHALVVPLGLAKFCSNGANDQAAAVAGIPVALDIPCLFQAVEHESDSACRQPSQFREFAGRGLAMQ